MSNRRHVYFSVAGVMLALLATGSWISGFASSREYNPRATVVNLRDLNGSEIGKARLTRRSGDVTVDISVRNLSPGFHGFHVHAIGLCDPATGFTSAGGHLNPAGNSHPNHAADMPVLLVNQDGTGEARFVTDRFTISDLFDTDGSALVIHASPDNYANIPARYAPAGPDDATLATGDAGGRAACGEIARR